MKKGIKRSLIQGFTLVEMLLVMVIISGIIYMGANYTQQRTLSLRIDRTSGQIQQILNASLAYYVAQGKWPANLAALQTTYLPNPFPSPWGGNSYRINPTSNALYVTVQLPSSGTSIPAIAKTITGTLPLSYTATSAPADGATTQPTAGTCTSSSNCYVVAGVNMPGQSTASLGTINFVNYYHNGACVPEPTCPSGYSAQIIVLPAQVNGQSVATSGSPCDPTDTSGCSRNYVSIDGFTAFTSSDTASPTPPACDPNSSVTDCKAGVTSGGNPTAYLPSGNYYRVCLGVYTTSGLIVPTTNTWGQLVGDVVAMTRCQSNKEATDKPSSDMTVWSN